MHISKIKATNRFILSLVLGTTIFMMSCTKKVYMTTNDKTVSNRDTVNRNAKVGQAVDYRTNQNDKLYRIRAGAMMSFQLSSKISNLEFSPYVAYMLTEKLMPGIGPIFSAYSYSGSEMPNVSGLAYGGRAFMRYYPFKRLFTQADLEFNVLPAQKDPRENRYYASPMVGLGYVSDYTEPGYVTLGLFLNAAAGEKSPYAHAVLFRIGWHY